MGVLDLPAPVFVWIDNTLLGTIAPLARLGVWALFISALSMALYTLISPQARLRALKAELRNARRELSTYDGDFEGVRTLAARNIGLSLRHLRLVGPSALIACIPVIMLIVWLAKAYGPAPTESGLPLDMAVKGGTADLHISEPADPGVSNDSGQAGKLRLLVIDENGAEVATALLTPALGRLEKHRWWHWLTAGRAVHLPEDAPVEAVHVTWPRRELLSFGPGWMRGWETPFLALAVVFSLGIQAAFRIE